MIRYLLFVLTCANLGLFTAAFANSPHPAYAFMVAFALPFTIYMAVNLALEDER